MSSTKLSKGFTASRTIFSTPGKTSLACVSNVERTSPAPLTKSFKGSILISFTCSHVASSIKLPTALAPSSSLLPAQRIASSIGPKLILLSFKILSQSPSDPPSLMYSTKPLRKASLKLEPEAMLLIVLFSPALKSSGCMFNLLAKSVPADPI